MPTSGGPTGTSGRDKRPRSRNPVRKTLGQIVRTENMLKPMLYNEPRDCRSIVKLSEHLLKINDSSPRRGEEDPAETFDSLSRVYVFYLVSIDCYRIFSFVFLSKLDFN